MMWRLTIYLTILLACVSLNLRAQTNLVYNGNFEQYSQCPDFVGQLDRCLGWSHAIYSVDYFNTCAPLLLDTSNRNNTSIGVPSNLFGFSYPKSGNGYIGLFVGMPMNFSDSIGVNYNIREWAGGSLIDSLIKDTLYHVKLNVSRPDYYNYAPNNIGVYFSDEVINYSGILHDSIFDNIDNNYLLNINESVCDTSYWHEYSFTYKAHGGEKYIYIGNFHSDINTTFNQCNTPLIYCALDYFFSCYYFIDDISIIKASEVNIYENAADNIQIYPNPAQDYFVVDGDKLKSVQVELFDISGRKLLQEKISTNQEPVNISGLSNGVYICVVNSNGQIVKRQKLIIQN